jgi:hypothetical protein
MLILRPRLKPAERTDALVTVFALLGNDYDFEFDFGSGSHQCCTEVIYRALHTRGPIRFSLIKRMGTQTLSADDIINTHLSAKEKPFSVILLAEEDTSRKGHQAILHIGDTGEKRLKQIMADLGDKK